MMMMKNEKKGWDTRIIGLTSFDCHQKKGGWVGQFSLLWRRSAKIPTPIEYHIRVL